MSSIAAFILLMIMGILMVSTINQTSLTTDEDPHIGSGYSYLTKRDYRLNPEHPPLAKDLAALPLLFLNPTFPDDNPAWADAINGQWRVGRAFLFGSGNDADTLIFWARVPMVLLTLLLGWYVFRWARERYGNAAALGALFLYTFSPAFIAHGRLVATDAAAAAGFFIAIYYFTHFLSVPTRIRLLKAGAALGFALLMKFSVVLLVPFFIVITILWVFIRYFHSRMAEDPEGKTSPRISLSKCALRYGVSLFLVFIIAGILIWIVYQYHVFGYPPERQMRDTATTLQTFGKRMAADPVVWMADKPALRALGQYLFGFLMVVQRAVGGNTTYFLGEVSNQAWWYYFPVVYILKAPLAFLIAEVIVILIGTGALVRWLRSIPRRAEKRMREYASRAVECADQYFPEIVMLLFIGMYWYSSMTSNLNIGIRHILPTFPFLYLLVGFGISRWIRGAARSASDAPTLRDKLSSMKTTYSRAGIRIAVAALLVVWYGGSTLAAYPRYLSYFNPIAGGSENGYRYVVDSNYDWGQDLKELAEYVDQKQIGKIAVHYFGWAPPEYYLEGRFEPWWFERGKPKGYFALSATFRQGALGMPDEAFIRRASRLIQSEANRRGITVKAEFIRRFAENANYDEEVALRHYQFAADRASQERRAAITADDVETILAQRTYNWLRASSPIDRVGNSIFIYYIP